MGGLTIETVSPGVQFIPDAAAAFRRANAQVRAEFGRDIDVNSTYRSWADQMLMFVNWNRYVNGTGPYPGHSKAVHPSESFHVAGTALDSDDWRNARIVAILADHGFIRNRLYVKGEDHHFEWLRSRDNHYGEPLSPPLTEQEIKMIERLVSINSKVYGVGFGRIKHVRNPEQLTDVKNILPDLKTTPLTDPNPVRRVEAWSHLLDFYAIDPTAINAQGLILDPFTGRYAEGNAWSEERATRAELRQLAARVK